MVRIERAPYHRAIQSMVQWASPHWPKAVLHSSGTLSPWSRWSYVAGPARLALRCNTTTLVTTLRGQGGVRRSWRDPREALLWLGGQASSPAVDGPPFKGGWVGWIGYDAGRLFEKLPARLTDPLGLPLFEFTFHTEVFAVDHVEQQAWRVETDDPFDAPPMREG